MAFSPKGMIWVLSIFERIRLSRYCAAIRERNSCLYRICKKNIFCSKYMIKSVIGPIFKNDNIPHTIVRDTNSVYECNIAIETSRISYHVKALNIV